MSTNYRPLPARLTRGLDAVTNAMGGVPLSRREALRRSVYGSAGLLLLEPLGVRAVESATPDQAVPFPAPDGVARSVIQIWLWGGPCHIDTFDPKPDAGREFTGALDQPIDTNVDGIRIGQLLPELAKQADKYSLIRGMTHGNNGHETAAYLVQTGRASERDVFPGAGAVVSYFKGYRAGYSGVIPPYIVLTQPQGRFSEAGFLGPGYKPFATGGDPNQQRFAVEGIVAQGLSDARQAGRRTLMHDLDSLGSALGDCPAFSALEQCEDAAYDLILGDARKLFDLSEEASDLRDRYGRSTFGQSCLMARRLVEAGVRFCTVHYDCVDGYSWDSHRNSQSLEKYLIPGFDQAFSAVLDDLDQRGLLEETLVVACGEMGRTPQPTSTSAWGRGHWSYCFPAVLAGAGIRGGICHGESDKEAAWPASHPVSPEDLAATIYHALGIDPRATVRDIQG
ncbi:MAG: DUF1501 domain-containing protein, partial [Verrucomicrobiae bacterium]|nr:DUF1501 domain-containing protein [Verrucomicrobiae bacterium]